MYLFDRFRHFFATRDPDGKGRDWIVQHSLTEVEVFRRLDGKTVALVGNARALLETRQGGSIDAHDIVIRINKAPGFGTDATGFKLDWSALADKSPNDQTSTVLWLGRKVYKIPYRLMTSGRLFVYDQVRRNELSGDLSARASTGIMAVELLLRSPARSVDLYGFDFYASRSLSGDHTIESTPHNYAEEEKWITARLADEPRLTLHRMGRGAAD
ncbi:MAG: glycosyltransferase family 29 protein [bacterium]